NYLNIGLMILSLGVAYYVPFELFLFSYAVLGPAHYLTEISWLHERKYFSQGKQGPILLTIAAILLFILVYGNDIMKLIYGEDYHSDFYSSGQNSVWTTSLVYIAFISSLFLVIAKKPFYRFIAFLLISASAFVSKSMFLFFSVFLPTLIHVYLFTMLFMLYGALKGRSKSGYLSVIVLLICPVIIVLFAPALSSISNYAITHYDKFKAVNLYSLDLWSHSAYAYPPKDRTGLDFVYNAVYHSRAGVTIMRFIAFAYTYHYLNWFSKTTVIKWHNIPKKRLLVIGILWLAAVGCYVYKYEVGFNVLFLLSFLHVFLEFPLNHVTFIGIYKETRSIISGKPVEPIPVKKVQVKKK
ncbi:MAG TPA: hypothetical protein VL651_14390, partial [Bacteroidia bacterium]|nr:hypothetical protein [Bacteroidia bacterium]